MNKEKQGEMTEFNFENNLWLTSAPDKNQQ